MPSLNSWRKIAIGWIGILSAYLLIITLVGIFILVNSELVGSIIKENPEIGGAINLLFAFLMGNNVLYFVALIGFIKKLVWGYYSLFIITAISIVTHLVSIFSIGASAQSFGGNELGGAGVLVWFLLILLGVFLYDISLIFNPILLWKTRPLFFKKQAQEK
jgi:hypothetical protein